MSSPSSRTVVWLAALLMAGAAGYWLLTAWPDARKPVHPADGADRGAASGPTRGNRLRPGFASPGQAMPHEAERRLLDLENIAAADPQRALRLLGAWQDSELQPLALAAVARGWASRAPREAAAWLLGLESPDDQVSACLGLVPAWAASAPEDCLGWVTARPESDLKEVSLVELAETWTATTPELAFQAFQRLPTAPGVERGLHEIVTQWALDDPGRALDFLTHTGPERRDEFLEAALVSLSNSDPSKTWAEAPRINNPARVEHVRTMALEAMAESQPQQAIQLAATAGNPPAMLKGLARGWASWDAPAAQAWIDRLPDPSIAGALRQEIQAQAAAADPPR